jgi:hypothetical protein
MEFERIHEFELGVDPEFRELQSAAQAKKRRELQKKAWRELHFMEFQRTVMRAIEPAKIRIPRGWEKKGGSKSDLGEGKDSSVRKIRDAQDGGTMPRTALIRTR